MAKPDKTVEAIRSVGIAKTDDYPAQVIRKGLKFHDDDARVLNNPSHFGTIDEVVERATADPGVKRTTPPRKPKPDTNAKNKEAAGTKAQQKAKQVKKHDKEVAKTDAARGAAKKPARKKAAAKK